MAEDVGSVYSEIRLKLDNLTSDIMTVSKKFHTLGQNMIAGVNRPSEQVRKAIENLTGKIRSNTEALAAMTKGNDTKTYFKELTNAIKEAEKAHDAETWATLEGEREKAQALTKEIEQWEKLKSAMEKQQAILQSNEEASRLATITNLSKEYETEVQRINALYEAGAINMTERTQQIMSAQQQELNGLARLKVAYTGHEKELKAIEKRMKTQTASYKEAQAAVGKGSGLQAAFNFAGINVGLGAVVDGVKSAAQAVAAFVKEGVAAYQEQEIAAARLSAVMKASGADAWTTMGELQDLAQKQSNATGRSVTEIQEMQAVLMGFTSITGDVFEDTTEGLIHMAAVMGGDLASAANQFGKALDTPAESLNTLTRYGFKFTEQQKEEVEVLEQAGKHAEAQRIILTSMKAAFGNAATAINDAAASQSNFNTAIYSLKTAAGEAFEKTVRPLRDFFTGLISPVNEARAALKKYTTAMSELEQVDVLIQRIGDLKNELTRLKDTKGAEETIAGINYQIAAMEEELTRLNGIIGGNQVKALTYELENMEAQLNQNVDFLGNNTDAHVEYLKRIRQINKDVVMSDIEKNNRRIEVEKEYRETIAKQIADGSYEVGNSGMNALILEQSAELQKQIALKREALAEARKIADEEARIRKEAAAATAQASADEKKEADETEKQKTAMDAIMALEHTYQESITKTQDLRNRGFIDELASYQSYQDARMQEINSLEEMRAALLRVQAEREKNGEGLTGDEIAQLQLINSILNRQTNQYKELDNIIKDKIIQQEIETSLVEDQIEATNKLYEAEKRRIEADEALEDITKGYTEQLEEQEIILKHQLGTDEDRIAKEKELLALERQRALEQLEASEDYLDATDTVKEEVIDAINAYFDAMEQGIGNIGKGTKAAESEINGLKAALQAAFGEDWGTAIYQGLQQLPAIVSSVASLITESVEREAKKQQKILDDQLKDEKKALKERHQQRLVDAGLASAETEKQYEAELEAALRTGDEVMVYKARQALEKAQIDQEYADEQERIENEIAEKKAKTQYEAEMTAWKLKLLSATASGAMAVVNGLATEPFVPVGIAMGTLAGTLTGLQIAAVAAAKPELSFQTGGIVPGNSFSGDNIPAHVNSGEGIFTADQMKAMGLMLNQQGSEQTERPIFITIVHQLDTIEIGRQTFKAANNGHYFLKERAIIR
jgi:hypothetical protein